MYFEKFNSNPHNAPNFSVVVVVSTNYAYFLLAYFTPAEGESDLCVSLHTQAKGITTNPLCSQRSWESILFFCGATDSGRDCVRQFVICKARHRLLSGVDYLRQFVLFQNHEVSLVWCICFLAAAPRCGEKLAQSFSTFSWLRTNPPPPAL